jgi:predicted ATPase
MPQNYNNKPINDQILFSFYNNKNTEENYNLYIKPIILKNSKFDFDFEEKKHYGGYYPYTSDDMAFYMFYNSHIKEILEYRSEKILKFQKIIDEYIQNKKVKVYPAGIRIYEKRIKIKEAGNFKVLTNYEKHIELHKLSSGEKKVLILFGLSMFCENLIYAIDEPELSLSVFWQEALLPDLLKYTNVKNLIVSTHSPNIIRNESLIDNIVYLPTGVYENE